MNQISQNIKDAKETKETYELNIDTLQSYYFNEYGMPYLKHDYRNLDLAHSWKIYITNIDEEKLSDFYYNTCEEYNEKFKALDVITFEDILLCKNPEIFFFKDNLSTEIISSKSIIKIKNVYIRFDVYDTLSPNHWSKSTPFKIVVNIEYSCDKKNIID